METGQFLDYQGHYAPLNLHDAPRSPPLAQPGGHHGESFLGPTPVGTQALLLPVSAAHRTDGIGALLEQHNFWLIGLLSGITIVLVLLSCSLKSSYFQDSYLFARAKEWVLPLQEPTQESLLSGAEAGDTRTQDDEGASPPCAVTNEPENLKTELCSWVSETRTTFAELGLQQSAMKSATDDDDFSTRHKVVPDMSALSLSDPCPIPAASAVAGLDFSQLDKDPVPASPRSKGCFAKSKDHFVFSNAADMFLTKSESLDEARRRTDQVVREHKCIKANKSVDEILTKQQQQNRAPGLENSQSSSFGTPKCRKLQERRQLHESHI